MRTSAEDSEIARASDGAAGAGLAGAGMNPHMAQLAAQTPGAFQQAAAGDDAAPQAGADGDAQHVGAAPGGADPGFTQNHAVGIVGHRHRQAQVCLQRRPDGCAGPAGQAAAGARHNALAAVNLTGGRNTHARRLLTVGPAVCQHPGGGFPHRIQNGGPVAVKADAGFGPPQHLAVPGHQAQFDGGAADVDSKIGFHGYLKSLMAAVKRAVISAGRVMAPPTTRAKAPASSALRACSG